TRASARIQPIRNNVANADATIIGLLSPPNECAIEFKPELHVTTADVCSGAFKKWTAAKSAETARIARYFRPVLRRTPKTIPRKNASSMNGTAIAAASRMARWKNVSKSYFARNEKTPWAASDWADQKRNGARTAPATTIAIK